MKYSLFRNGITLAVVLLLFNIAFASGINAKMESSNEKTVENATVYLGWFKADLYRISINGFFVLTYNKHGHSVGTTLEFDANLSEVSIKAVMNYTATVNYTAGPPIVLLTPFFAFGLKIENDTDYSWEYFKLKHENGLCEKKGNISVNVTLDMSSIKKGDKIILYPTMNVITDPFLVRRASIPNFKKMVSPLLRFAFLFPRLHDTLLEPLILPFYAKYNSHEIAWIVVNFV